MKLLFDTFRKTGNLHHAHLIVGSTEFIFPELIRFLENEFHFSMQANPDCYQINRPSFGIEESRKLRQTASNRALSTRQIFIVSFESITHEAQNALLKLLEEPTPNTYFFFVISSEDILLPTLRSRFFTINTKRDEGEMTAARDFLQYSKSKRLQYIKKIVDAKDKGGARNLLDSLEQILYVKLKDDHKIATALKEIQNAKQYIFDRGSSMKMILEHVALTI